MAAPLDVDRSRAAWGAFGLGLAAVLGMVLYTFIGTLVFGVFLYYATRPVYKRLNRQVRPASLAAVLSLLVLAMPVVLLGAYTVSIGIQELTRLANTTDLGAIEEVARPYVNVTTIPLTPEELLASSRQLDPSILQGIAATATTYLGVIGGIVLNLFVVIAVAFYLLRDGGRLSRWLRRQFGDDAGVLDAYMTAVDRSFHNVFFGNILNALLTAAIGAIVYSVLAAFAPPSLPLPYPALLGLLAGAASLIPIVGMKLVYVPMSVYLAGRAVFLGEPRLLWFAGVFAVVSLVLVDTIPDLVLRPYVSGRDLHVGLVMLAYVLGPLLFGWYGLFLGPMLLVLIVKFGTVVLPRLVAGESLRPVAVDPSYLTDPDGGAEANRTPDPEGSGPGGIEE